MTWIFALTVGAHTWAARRRTDDPDASPELIQLSRGDQAKPSGTETPEPRPMPSAVWTDGVTTVVAEEAVTRGKSDPTNLIADPAGLLGADPVRRGARLVEPVDLVAAVLTEAYARALAATGAAPVEVLLTHPDSWTSEQVLALRQAAYRARLGVDLVVEGVAAASAYSAWGGPGTRVLVMDADRGSAAAVAKVNRVFVVLASAGTAGGSLRALADEVLGRPGVRRELLNDVILLDSDPRPDLVDSLTGLTGRPPSELSRAAVVLGALHYHRALTPTAAEPIVLPPPPPPPSAPVQKVNHYAPAKKERKLALVPLLILILVFLVAFELLFVYWPF